MPTYVLDPSLRSSDQRAYCEGCWTSHLLCKGRRRCFAELSDQLLQAQPQGCARCQAEKVSLFAAAPGNPGPDLRWRCRGCWEQVAGGLPIARLQSPPPVVTLAEAKLQRARALCNGGEGILVASDYSFVCAQTAVGRAAAKNRDLLRRAGCVVREGVDAFGAAEYWATHFREVGPPQLVVWGAPHWHVDGCESAPGTRRFASVANDDFNGVALKELRAQFPAARVVVPFPNYYERSRASEAQRLLVMPGVDYAPLASDPRWHWRLADEVDGLRCLVNPAGVGAEFDLVEELRECLAEGNSVLFLGEWDFALSAGLVAALF